MQFQQLSAFKAVYELGTVTAAADFIHITQPAASRLISSLERNVGFKLFQRVKGRLLPTEKGKAFYLEVSKAYSALESLSESAADIKQSNVGSLHISAFPLLSVCYLPQLLANYLKSKNRINLSLKTYRSEEVQRRTALQVCDIGFSVLPPITDGVASLEVSCECVCLLPPNSTLQNKEVITPADLIDSQLISGEKDDVQRLIDNAFKRSKVKMNEIIEVSLASSIASFVAEGVGVAIVDPFTAHYAQQLEDKVSYGPFHPKVLFTFFILYPSLKGRSEIVDDFIRSFFSYASKQGIKLMSKGYDHST